MTRPARHRAATAVGTALVSALALAAPAGATHEGAHPTARTERTFVHCAGPTKAENVNLFATGPPGWNTTAPTQSLTAGGGCGALDSGALRGGNPQTLYDAVFRGKFTGNIRDMTLELHNLLLGRVRNGATFTVRVRMLIDGVPIFPETLGRSAAVTPQVVSSGLVEKLLISIPNLGCARDIVDADGNVTGVVTDGLMTDDGEGAVEHDIQIAIDSNFEERAGAWMWDATEVPTGITFNPDGLAPAQVLPTKRATC
ncbi:MAG: hypothetical protein M3245_05310 [Actinomycetota bacterium]|nr:hypothetical protein [Actinomycetota bacterium]